MFRIEMLPAGHGDSILISYGETINPKHILIDGGPYYFYANNRTNQLGEHQALSNRLHKLAQDGSSLELLTITHIDADHIEAVVKWIGSHPETLPIKDIWFNGRNHLGRSPGWMGPQEGEFLGHLIKEYELPWNERFGHRSVVCQPNRVVEKDLDGGMKLTLLSPDMDDLQKLAEVWDAVLEREGFDNSDHQEILRRLDENRRLRPEPDRQGWMGQELDVEELAETTFKEDSAPANGSSIAFLAEYEGKSAMFTGDALPSTLVRNITQLLEDRGETILALDAFKIPHHGSRNNINQELLQLLDCKRYLISTNGNYFHHPDKEAIARILKYGASAFRDHSFECSELCFNYHKPAMAVWDDEDLSDLYGYRAVFPPVSGASLVIDL